MAMIMFQKHAQFPGPGRTERNVVGVRVMPVFAVKSGRVLRAGHRGSAGSDRRLAGDQSPSGIWGLTRHLGIDEFTSRTST